MVAPARVPVTIEHTGTRQGVAIQTNAAKTATAFNQFPLQPGVLIKAQRFTANQNTVVTHGLGRVPGGYMFLNVVADPTQSSATAAFGVQRYAPANPNTDERQAIVLFAWQNYIADIWVY